MNQTNTATLANLPACDGLQPRLLIVGLLSAYGGLGLAFLMAWGGR